MFLKKYYTCDALDVYGDVIGSVIVSVWFFQSPLQAYMSATDALGGLRRVNFRRIR